MPLPLTVSCFSIIPIGFTFLVPTYPDNPGQRAVKRVCVCVHEDGTDGKQARRTNSCSPLGELFDHGLDSWASLLMPVGMYSVFGRGDYSVTPDRCLLVFMGVMFTFFCSHWEKYNTGTLFLPWGYDVSQLVGGSAHIFTTEAKTSTSGFQIKTKALAVALDRAEETQTSGLKSRE